MAGAGPGAGVGEGAGKPPAADPTMEDILASIRRILNEDEAPPSQPEGNAPAAEGPLLLTEAMLVQPEARPEPETTLMSAADIAALFDDPPAQVPASVAVVPVLAQQPDFDAIEVEAPPPVAVAVSPAMAIAQPSMADAAVPAPSPMEGSDALLGAAAAAAATAAVSQLMRTVANERSASVFRGGPSIEDVVREEIRPLLKDWLDTHLPPLVERLVRAEIERVVGRAVG